MSTVRTHEVDGFCGGRTRKQEDFNSMEAAARYETVRMCLANATSSGVLETANKVINGDRQDTYGSPEDSFARIASYWSMYLGIEVRALDVAHMMVLFKLARTQGQKPSRDNYVDICGYAAIAGDRLIK